MINFLKDVLKGAWKFLTIFGLAFLLVAPIMIFMAIALRESSWIWGAAAILCFLLTIGVVFALKKRGNILY